MLAAEQAAAVMEKVWDLVDSAYVSRMHSGPAQHFSARVWDIGESAHTFVQSIIDMASIETFPSYLAARLGEGGEYASASVGVISLGGVEQARELRKLLLEHLTDRQLSQHRVVVGDASSFQVRSPPISPRHTLSAPP